MGTRWALVFVMLTSSTLVCCGSQRQLTVVQATAPNYPSMAKMAHIEGDIVVEVNVAPDGKVSDATIVSGPPLLRQESVAAAREWIFAKGPKQSRKQMLTFEFRAETIRRFGGRNLTRPSLSDSPPAHPLEVQAGDSARVAARP